MPDLMVNYELCPFNNDTALHKQQPPL